MPDHVRNTTNIDSSDGKIISGLERLSQVFRALLWEKAKNHSLSPIQIQILLYLHRHPTKMSNISALAKEFQVTKPTISDAVKILSEKNMVAKQIVTSDNRKYTMTLTQLGQRIVANTADYALPIVSFIEQLPIVEKTLLWKSISSLINSLYQTSVITVHRTCYNCVHYSIRNGQHFCGLLQQTLESDEIRINCNDFDLFANS